MKFLSLFASLFMLVGCSSQVAPVKVAVQSERVVGATVATITDMQKAENLVPVSSATVTAVANGNWSNPATWNTNALPVTGDMVEVPVGLTVNLDTTTPQLRWLRIDGNFTVATNVPTKLWCETVVTIAGSTFTAGTVDNPITSTFRFVAADSGPIDTTIYDPYFMSRGFIAMGPVTMVGNTVSPYCYSVGSSAGDTSVTLITLPIGWNVGDTVLFPGKSTGITKNSYHVPVDPIDDDVVTITAINGNVVTFTPALVFNHKQATLSTAGVFTETTGLTSGWDRPALVSNITPRSIDFSSQNISVIKQRGHVMMMNQNQDVIHYVSFTELGRTDKSQPITDPDGTNDATLANPRARYAYHNHVNMGQLGVTTPADIYGCLVNGSPGWGFVNHASYVNFNSCVGYRVFGATFAGENGSEIGAFTNCLALRSTNTKIAFVTDQIQTPLGPNGGNANWGTGGEGFWTQAGGIVITNCTVFNTPSAGFVIMGLPFQRSIDPTPTYFNPVNLQPGYSWTQTTPLLPAYVPQNHSGLVSVGCVVGFAPWRLNEVVFAPSLAPEVAQATMTNVYTETLGQSLFLGYSSWLNFQNIKSVCYGGSISALWAPAGFTQSGIETQINYTNVIGIGFPVFMVAPTNLNCNLTNMTTDAPTGLLVNQPFDEDPNSWRNLTISNFTQLPMSAAMKAGLAGSGGTWYQTIQNHQQYKVVLYYAQAGESLYTINPPTVSPNILFPPFTQYSSSNRDVVSIDGKVLFFPEEGRDFLLSKVPSVPPFLATLTNGQLQDQYNVAIGARILPLDVVHDTTNYALYSPSNSAPVSQPAMTVSSINGSRKMQLTGQKTGFVLTVQNAEGQFVSAPAVNLNDQSWNVVQITADNVQRGVFVWCDSTKTWPPSWPTSLVKRLAVKKPATCCKTTSGKVGKVTVTKSQLTVVVDGKTFVGDPDIVEVYLDGKKSSIDKVLSGNFTVSICESPDFHKASFNTVK